MPGREAHVGERRARLPRALRRRRAPGRARTPLIGSACSGLVPQVTIGSMRGGVERHLAVEARAGVGRERTPVRKRRVPLRALRRERPAGEVGNVVSSGATMPARAPASIDMLQTVSRSSIDTRAIAGAGILDDVADRAGGADLRDDREDHVLGA